MSTVSSQDDEKCMYPSGQKTPVETGRHTQSGLAGPFSPFAWNRTAGMKTSWVSLFDFRTTQTIQA
jgi:hypothetical protein